MTRSRQRGATKLIIILFIVIALLMTLGGTLGGLYMAGFLAPNDEPESEPGSQIVMTAAVPPPLYKELEPAITVNVNASNRRSVLQARVQIMARHQATLDAVEKHMPIVRNNLILLFSSQNVDELSSREGKEMLREQALVEINDILTENEIANLVEAVYFTSFVMQ